MGDEGFGDLQANRQHRVERGHRFLKHHADLPAAQPAQAFGRHGQHILPLPGHLAGNAGEIGQQAGDGPQADGFAGAAFTDQPQYLAPADREADPIDGVHGAMAGGEGDGEVADLEQGGHFFTASKSASPSPVRLKPMPASTMATPGKSEIHGAVVKKFLPSAISTPHSAVGGCAPRPR